jgi:hypothetical protein
MKMFNIAAPRVIANCQYGLGNRIMTLLCAFYTSKRYNFPLEVLWVPTNECDCMIDDLFILPESIKVINELPNYTSRSLVVDTFNIIRPSSLPIGVDYVHRDMLKESNSLDRYINKFNDLIVITTSYFFIYPHKDVCIKDMLCDLKIRPYILKSALKFIKKNKITKKTLGVHFRRTDIYSYCDQLSKTHELDTLVTISNSTEPIFIASDDYALEEILSLYKHIFRYPSKAPVIYDKKTKYLHRSKQSIIDALITCIIMSRTTIFLFKNIKYKSDFSVYNFLGPGWSSFLMISYYFSFLKDDELFNNKPK